MAAPWSQAPLPIAVLYSELHELSGADEHRGSRAGGFAAKLINGRRYWYHQRWVGGKRVQKLIGPESPELLLQIDEWRSDAKESRMETQRRSQIVRSLKAALQITTDPISGRIIARLAELGLFKAGAVLIGTHAFHTYGPMLGVRLGRSNLRTGDIDFAAVDQADSALRISFAEAVQSANSAFFVVPARPGSRISTALKQKGGELRVELLTPLKSGRPWTPEIINSLRFGAQRAPFLDYLIENAVAATYLSGGGSRVRVPHPARFAWHKLIVAANRDVSSATKAMKDAAQANELFRALLSTRADDVRVAARAIGRHGRSYLRKARQGAIRLEPDIKDPVLRYLK
jgi:hypothetical protein